MVPPIGRALLALGLPVLALAGAPVNPGNLTMYGAPPYTMQCSKVKEAYRHSECCGSGPDKGFVPAMNNCRHAVGWGKQVIDTREFHLPIGTAPSVAAVPGALELFTGYLGMPATMTVGQAIAAVFAGDARNWWLPSSPKQWRGHFTHLLESANNRDTKAACTHRPEDIWNANPPDLAVLQNCGDFVDQRLTEITPSCHMFLKHMLFPNWVAFAPVFKLMFHSFEFTYMLDEAYCTNIEVPARSMMSASLADARALFATFSGWKESFDFTITHPTTFNKCIDL